MRSVNGLHHITAIAGAAQENLDFYAGVLGMRLVKKSVNQDDPGTYHLFYADAEGRPGTDLTFFPWAQMAPPRMGYGLAVEVGLEVPRDSLSYWGARLEKYGTRVEPIETRFGERALPFTDPHGLRLSLVEPSTPDRPFTPWERAPSKPSNRSGGFITAASGSGTRRPRRNSSPRCLASKISAPKTGGHAMGSRMPGAASTCVKRATHRRGAWGVGSVHHLAWRVDDEAHQHAVSLQIEKAGGRPTPVIDRFWFKSVYFREPGGVLFELATDGPGFAADEDPAHLGETLVLPPWLEASRARIESVLPPLRDVKEKERI